MRHYMRCYTAVMQTKAVQAGRLLHHAVRHLMASPFSHCRTDLLHAILFSFVVK